MPNFLPNTQWQIISAFPYFTKMNSLGTGTLPSISVSGYTSSAKTVIFNTTNTWELKIDDVVYFTGADAAVNRAPMRVTSVVTNTSFTCILPFQGTSSTSRACTAFPIGNGDPTGGSSGAGPDGWGKTASLIFWRDDFSVNNKPGSRYSLGMRKGSNSTETFSCNLAQPYLYRGRQIVFGAWINQTVKGGAGTFRLGISDGTTTTYSSSGTSGSYQWLEVSATIANTAPSISVFLELNGVSGDVYYLSQPRGDYGSSLGTGNYFQTQNEYINFTVHNNAPSLNPFSGSFPSSPYTGSTYYGYELDIEGLTYGKIARTVKSVRGKTEMTSAAPGLLLFQASYIGAPQIFGPEVGTQVANVTNCCDGEWLMDQGQYLEGFFALFTGTSGGNFTNITVDFSGARLN